MEALSPDRPTALANGFIDTYADDRLAGQVIGTAIGNVVRGGVDVEGVIGIDNGALRIQPLLQPGWGRAGVAYGPYRRTNGLAFGIFLLNGHNTSQTGDITDSLPRRLVRWLRASGVDNPARRLLNWGRSAQMKKMFRRLQYWARNVPGQMQGATIDENLAIGWFSTKVPACPLAEGNALVMHAAGPENGELWLRTGASLLPAIRSLQNIPMHYLIVLRERGAAYYAASLPNAHGLPAYPYLRPVAVDHLEDSATLYAAFYQSVLGQIGFYVDTRVYSTQVAQVPELATWYGSAHAADTLCGNGSLSGSAAEVGGSWSSYSGSYERTAQGVMPAGVNNLAVLDPGEPSGLVNVLIKPAVPLTATITLLWRFHDRDNYWGCLISRDACELYIWENGVRSSLAMGEAAPFQVEQDNALQILDDGETFGLYLNGHLLFNERFSDTRLQAATGVGFHVPEADNGLHLWYFEAHPRLIPMPAVFNLGQIYLPEGKRVLVADDFGGVAADLAGRVTSQGDKVWRREIGKGVIELTGRGVARVRATVQEPNPGRTAYTIAWDNSNFADLAVLITPPGMQKGQGEKGRGGLIFWQDADNYIIIGTWLDDHYGGASVSSFFHLQGFEELYDAVWTNVGRRVRWGIPYHFRVVCDGMNYLAFVNDEPVLYRALTDVYPHVIPLGINRVGIVANWEWGNDTGSTFADFVGISI